VLSERFRGTLEDLTLYQAFPMLPGRRAQVWRHQPAFRRPRHFHAEPELNVVLRGRAVLAVGDRQFELLPGELLLLQPGQDHALVAESSDLDLFVVALTPELAERANVHRHRRVGKRGLAPEHLENLESMFVGSGTVCAVDSVETHLAERFAELWNQFAPPDVLSRRALEKLHVDGELTEIAIARALAAEPSALSRRIHKDLAVRLVDYRARLRLIRFVERVDAGNSFTSAALEAGFGSYAQCHRVFQRGLGCSPREYFGGQRQSVNDALVEG
jgi:quercetin dioxygenase-like cupin family protein/AraC-like DNA-binding protein